MTLTDSAVQVGTSIEVELSNPTAMGVAIATVACPDSNASLRLSNDSPMFAAQLRGYTK